MRIEYKTSFERSIKAVNPHDKEEIKKVINDLIDILSTDRPLQQGLGLKRLQGSYWEIRKGLKARVLFRWQKEFVEFILVGHHDDIKRFLKSVW